MAAETEGSLEKKPRLSAEDEDYDSDSPAENKFANDGSFMEMFKKKMAAEQKDSGKQKDQEIKTAKNVEQDVPELKVFKAGIGKRKTLMKTNELREKRKRRREEQEELKSELEAANGTTSSAWKMYLSEVQSYEDQSCTDKEGHRRPLVK